MSARQPARRAGAPGIVVAALLLVLTVGGLAAGLLVALGIPLADVGLLVVAGRAGYVVRTVAVGAAVIGVAGGVLGSFAVMRGQSLLGDAVSHSALPGIFLVFMAWSVLGLAGVEALGTTLPAARSLSVVLLGALATGLLATVLIFVAARETKLKEDAALGVTLSWFFGIGIVLRSLLQNNPRAFGNRAGLESFLYGSTATMTRGDVWFIGLLTALAVLAVLAFWKEFKLLAFDPPYLATMGYPVRALDALLTALIVVSVIVGLQMVGVILMSAMLIAPAVAARQWTDRFEWMVVLATLFGVTSGLVGVVASSVRASLATGPVIAVFVTALALVSLLVAPNRGLLWQAWQRYRLRRRFEVDTLLLHLAEQERVLSTEVLTAQLGWSPRQVQSVAGRAVRHGAAARGAGGLRLTAAGQRRVNAVLETIGTGAVAGTGAAV